MNELPQLNKRRVRPKKEHTPQSKADQAQLLAINFVSAAGVLLGKVVWP